MIELQTRGGLCVDVPETLEEDRTPRFGSDRLDEIARYYREHGYVVVEGVVPPQHCSKLRSLWDRQVKASRRFIYRQTNARAERNEFNASGWVTNPVLNLQSLDPKSMGEFRTCAIEEILAAPDLTAIMEVLLEDRPKIVQSMYFEGNSATWEHQDSYYLDSENYGRMVGAWIAIESIEARAGRFFVCPGSHKIELPRHTSENSIADKHDTYIASVVARMQSLGMDIRAPRLETGDVLFWSSKTIHGSMDSRDAEHSRSSVTCHAIPAGDRFAQFQRRVMDVPTDRVKGIEVYRPKDLAKVRNRLILWLESTFPRQFYWMKRQAVRRVVADD